VKIALRSVDRALTGASAGRYAASPYIVFGVPGTMAGIRRRMRAARDYIVAVTKAVQTRADVVAQPATPTPAATDPDLANRPATADSETADATLAERPALPDETQPPDSGLAERPALPEEATAPARPPNINRPAVDPHAPALEPDPASSPKSP